MHIFGYLIPIFHSFTPHPSLFPLLFSVAGNRYITVIIKPVNYLFQSPWLPWKPPPPPPQAAAESASSPSLRRRQKTTSRRHDGKRWIVFKVATFSPSHLLRRTSCKKKRQLLILTPIYIWYWVKKKSLRDTDRQRRRRRWHFLINGNGNFPRFFLMRHNFCFLPNRAPLSL